MSRGRWRLVKRRMQAFAQELGYPGCLKFTDYDSVVGMLMQASVKQRSFAKLSRVRTHPGASREARRLHDEQRRRVYLDPDAIPF